jgi:hypothetical protein
LSTVLLPILDGIVSSIAFSTLPAPLFDYLQSTPIGVAAVFSRVPPFLMLPLIIVVTIAGVASFVGLWKFRPWGRLLYVVITVLYVACMPLMGLLVVPPAATPLFYLGYLLQGALIAMAYLPPVADLFTTQKV